MGEDAIPRCSSAPAIPEAAAALAAAQRTPPQAPALRRAIRQGRAALLARLQGEPGLQACAHLSAFFETILHALFEALLRHHRPEQPVALLALGGLGRRELAPGSDLDLLVLHAQPEPGPALERLATAFLQLLWDSGLVLGHQVRSLAGARAALHEDLGTATAIAEGRLLAGDAALAEQLLEIAASSLLRRDSAFLRAKLEEAAARHARRGGTPFVLEPHLKDSPGALRDLELLRLLARAGVRPPLAPQLLERARERLLRMRFVLHLLAGRRRDVLDLEIVPELAERIVSKRTASGQPGPDAAGELPGPMPRDAQQSRPPSAPGWFEQAAGASSAAARLMRSYYAAAAAVSHALAHCQEQLAAGGQPRRCWPLGERFVATGETIGLRAPAPFDPPADSLQAAFELLLLAQREKLRVPPSVIEQLRPLAGGVHEAARTRAALARTFLELLAGHDHVAASLRAMRDAGLLGAFLPEFGEIEGLWLPDPFHRYTVDEHTLRALEALERFAEGGRREDALRAELLGRQRQLAVLRLALLLHDVGKGKGGDHCAAGTALVPEVARRLGLEVEQGRLLRFLVEHHLLMAETAERRDLSAPETIAHFVAKVGDEQRLELLYLLTAADSVAAGPHGLPRYKDALLTELYRRARAALRAPLAPPPAAALRAQLLAALPAELGPEDLDRHMALMPPRYRYECEPFEVVQHLRLVHALEREQRGLALLHASTGALHHLWVGTRDRMGLFRPDRRHHLRLPRLHRRSRAVHAQRRAGAGSPDAGAAGRAASRRAVLAPAGVRPAGGAAERARGRRAARRGAPPGAARPAASRAGATAGGRGLQPAVRPFHRDRGRRARPGGVALRPRARTARPGPVHPRRAHRDARRPRDGRVLRRGAGQQGARSSRPRRHPPGAARRRRLGTSRPQPARTGARLRRAPGPGTMRARRPAAGGTRVSGFGQRVIEAVRASGTPLVAGIDPQPRLYPPALVQRLPPEAAARQAALLGAARALSLTLVELAAAEGLPAIKANAAFFEALGPAGMELYAEVLAAARAAGLLAIADVKRGDIGSTAEAYAAAYLGTQAPFRADAITASPYLGPDALAPLVQAAHAAAAGVFVLVRTSNPGAAELQDLELRAGVAAGGSAAAPAAPRTVHEAVAARIARWNEELAGAGAGYGPVGAVVGATVPEALARLRSLLPRSVLLLPGVGSQGGSTALLRAAFDARGEGALVPVSRALAGAWRAMPPTLAWQDAIREAMRGLRDELHQLLAR
ncbi:MAG: hypothetical protein KatS3mg102_2720 [Planctomycetota bacterium]|nr:MAG: hypothetical protein KatS3mg102_2720 [Planctomycetota bacterium]